MISADDYARFEQLRADLFDAIAKALDEDGHCKSYEGSFRLQFPNYFESLPSPSEMTDSEPWGILLDCYVIGPSRHYEWWGATFADVLQKADTDIRAWMHEAHEDA